MRRFFVIAATAVALAATALLTPQAASAMALGGPSGMRQAIDAASVVEAVPCRLVRRCGPFGCGWRRVCWAGPPVYYAPQPYYYYAPRPYPYWGWRGRYWRRW